MKKSKKDLKSIQSNIGNTSSIDDIFNQEFDITFFKTNKSMISDLPRTMSTMPGENAEDDGLVSYIYNNEYFRCDDFTDEHSGTHILFAGCSQTEGMGAPLETTWAKLLYNDLKDNNIIDGYFNIARAGFGWQKIISNFLIYEKRYGTPEYLFILLPDVSRMFQWDLESHSWSYTQKSPDFNDDIDERFNKSLSESEHRKAFIDFAAGWSLFESYCKAKNINLLWSTWDYEENENLRRFLNLDNYVELGTEGLDKYIKHVRPDGKLEKFDLFRRDGHLGILPNQYWYILFKDSIIKRGWLK